MPCTEAVRVARGTLVRMGYTIGETELPKPGRPGNISGRKAGAWSPGAGEAGEPYDVQVRITCSDRGAEFDAVTREPLTSRLSFRHDFPAALEQVASRRVVQPRVDDAPRPGLQISLRPLRGSEASGEFGVDLAALGITPVRVEIANRTGRAYAFRPDGVRLVTQEGQRTKALPLPGPAAGLDAEHRRRLRDALIAEGEVAPGATLKGYLYFPAVAYRRATLIFTDRESGEEEGFRVEF